MSALLDLAGPQTLAILSERAQTAYKEARRLVFDHWPNAYLTEAQRRALSELEAAEVALADYRRRCYSIDIDASASS
jgi:hypothetical protein